MSDLRTELAALADEQPYYPGQCCTGFCLTGLHDLDADTLTSFREVIRTLLAKHPAPTADRDEVAEVIWATSRADESTISATGANHVTAALLARFDVRRKA